MSVTLDPVKYEVFVQRLASVLEEGRQAVAMISGSPAIVEGGEFMTSLYEGNGSGVMSAAGTLFHVMGSADSIRHALSEFEVNPGIRDGDQFFYNDPYIAGTHVMDQIVIKPVFHAGVRVAWVGTMTHTGDVGGMLRGASTEIFHEGLRIRGLKIVEGGTVRKDTFESVTLQCRDPGFVAQDILARIAANNVCAEGYLSLMERFGIEFAKAACAKLTRDAEARFREKLKKIPDGTWRERVYISRTRQVEGKEVPLPLGVICTLTKEGDHLSFDVDASAQTEDYCNAALPSSRSCLFSALAAALLSDIPWNSDVMDWVSYHVPEGSFLNCRFPASNGLGTQAGINLNVAAAGALARMLYAAGHYEDVNASWGALSGAITNFGPGVWYGGHSQHGGIVGQGTYDLFTGGQGATPARDGNNTGGIYVNPRSAGADVEWTESYYPLLYLAQRHGKDSGGYGKFRGGMNLESIAMVYGTQDLSTDFLPGPEGGEARGFGLFGGYPVGGHLGDGKLILTAKEAMLEKLAAGRYPTNNDELGPPWGENIRDCAEPRLQRQLGGIRVSVPEYSLLGYSFGCGGGYGDPLDRDPNKVADDVRNDAVTLGSAREVYGVAIDAETLELQTDETEDLRQALRQERLGNARRLSSTPPLGSKGGGRKALLRITEYLEIAESEDGTRAISCVKCGNDFCPPGDNYKKYALRRVRDLREMKKVGEGQEPITNYQEYICPGCGTLLQVDPWCEAVHSAEPLWDIDIRL